MPEICEFCNKDQARYLTIQNGQNRRICPDCTKNNKLAIIMDNPKFWSEDVSQPNSQM